MREQPSQNTQYEYTCLQCGAAMEGHRCKVQCRVCGYREDCSDACLIDYDRVEQRAQRKASAVVTLSVPDQVSRAS